MTARGSRVIFVIPAIYSAPFAGNFSGTGLGRRGSNDC